MSPMTFNVGLEQIFKEADEINSIAQPLDGIEVRGELVSRVGFADDVTEYSSEGAPRLSTTMQNIQYVADKACMSISAKKSYAQHIGRAMSCPPVTSADIAALDLKRQCPKPWCTRRFSTQDEVRGHLIWHKCHEGGKMDYALLATGMIVCARGPPWHRFFLVSWPLGQSPPQWVLGKHFREGCHHLVDLFFSVN